MVAILVAAAFGLAACATASSSTNARPADFYAAVPSLSAMRQVLGDSNWWPLPPSFGVPPLDSDRSLPFIEKFSVTQGYAHVGTAEIVAVTYVVLASSTIATVGMTQIVAPQASPVTSPKIGEQAAYTQTTATGAAPYESRVYVKIGPTITAVSWLRRDGFATPSQIAKVAARAVARVNDVLAGKLHASPPPQADQTLLPPPGFNITLLGYARIPTESAVLDIGFSSAPEQIVKILNDAGIKDALYGDYVLNDDTHMEVKALLLDFGDPSIAGQWLDLLRGSTPLDSNGIFSTYSQSTGRYYFAFVAGGKAALMTCAATGVTEAASRACETPLNAESGAWKLSLGG